MLCWEGASDYEVVLPSSQTLHANTFMHSARKSSVPLPWSSTTHATHNMEQISGPPARTGTCYQTPRSHPWRPTMGYEAVQVTPLHEQPITNALVASSYSPSAMCSDPVTFPNLVTGFERNPQHAARAALYTRYTPNEWTTSNVATYADADKNRNYAEKVRSEAVRLMRETDEKTSQGQRDAARRLGERITDITFWRNELNTELEKLVAESAQLTDTKRNVQKALQDLDPPLHITQECLYHREGRKSIELVHDHVEKSLLVETDNLRSCQEKLSQLLARITKQLADCRAAQHSLEDDLSHKESALGIDSLCHQLNNYSRGINYYGGIEKYDPTVSTPGTWSGSSSTRINNSHSERSKSCQLRSDAESLINAVATSVWDCWSNTNNAFNNRSSEMLEAKSKMQLHLHKTQQEIFDVEKHIELLRKAINDKSNPMKVAQTRLEARAHRPGIEMCRDNAHLRLVEEVCHIQDSVSTLHRKLQEAEAQHQQLLKTKSQLENNLKQKVDALFIDREKCMGLRRSFPVNNTIKY
ncbi:tektin-3 isoform X1 [Culex quinquefasciatus]|uniref:tektin-3 isoform X1 n=1 Tax=Culex quinquefasciatus TaxID=7176 RepID=UPI0018E37F73|nr:tektin-3 isoform X1 [Culex quinquefasciatus]